MWLLWRRPLRLVQSNSFLFSFLFRLFFFKTQFIPPFSFRFVLFCLFGFIKMIEVETNENSYQDDVLPGTISRICFEKEREREKSLISVSINQSQTAGVGSARKKNVTRSTGHVGKGQGQDPDPLLV